MAIELELLPPETSVETTSPQHRFENAVDAFLTSTREIFFGAVESAPTSSGSGACC